MTTHFQKMKNKTEALIIKRGATAETAAEAIKENFEIAFKSAPEAKASWFADFCVSV